MSTLLSINKYHHRRDGSEVVYLEHNRLFTQRGWDVVPFAMRHDRNLPTAWSSYFPPEIDLEERHGWSGRVASLPGVVYSLEARRCLRRLLEVVRPDVAHCHSIYHHLSPSILDELRRHDVPVVMTVHDLKLACPAYLMYSNGAVCERCHGGALRNVVRHRCVKGSVGFSAVAWFEAQLHRVLATYGKGISRFVSPSAFYIDKLVEWGWDRDRFVHVANFVDADQFVPRLDPGPAFLYFGRLSAEKGVRTLVEAVAASGSSLRVVGAGPLDAELRAPARTLGADVTFLGRLEGADLWDEVARARATVVPSEWFENAPMTVLEAYAMGKPVIAASVGGIPELVDERTGWLFPSGSVDELAAVLRSVADLTDDDVAERGARARQRVDEDRPDRYVEQMSKVYRDLGVGVSRAERGAM